MDTDDLARAWPRGRLLGFEPVPTLRAQVENQIKGLVSAISSGASGGSCSLLCPTGTCRNTSGVMFREKINVPVVTLGDWAYSQGTVRVDFLWLGLQRGELAALQGARILPTIRAIYTPKSLKQGAPLYPEFRTWMEAWGFR